MSNLRTEGNIWEQGYFQKQTIPKVILNYKLFVNQQFNINFNYIPSEMLAEFNKFSVEESPNLLKSAETSIQRATYILLGDGNNLPQQVEIFTKTGNSDNYSLQTRVSKSKYETQVKSKKFIAKKRKNSSDDQYNVKNQKKDRNVISNLIHHLVKYLNSTSDLEMMVKNIIKIQNLEISFEEFYAILETESRNLKTYVTIKHIKDLWFSQGSDKKNFCLIMRVLSRNFYNKIGFLSIFYSNKFNKASKNVHYKGLRNLIQVLLRKDIQQLKYMSS